MERNPVEVDLCVDDYDPRVALLDPYPTYHALRDKGRVLWNEPTKSWLVTGYDEVRSVIQDDQRFGQQFKRRETIRYGDSVLEQPYFELFRRMLFLLDGEDHSRVRPLFTRWFTRPDRIKIMTPLVERVVSEVLDTIDDQQSFDLVESFAYSLPLNVISSLLDLPNELSAEIVHDVHSVVAIIDPVEKTAEVKRSANDAIVRLRAKFEDVVKERRAKPGDDLLTALIADLDEGRFRDPDEMLANVLLMYIAGHETTTDSLSLGLLTLFRHRDQLEKFKSTPSIMRTAVEELLRYDGTAQGFGRIPYEDVMIGDTSVKAGQPVLLLLAAANRDPAVFPDPDRLDLERKSTRSVTFGGGAHVCLGNMLARLEMQVGLEQLFKRKPNLELETIDPPIEDFKAGLVRGLRRLAAHC